MPAPSATFELDRAGVVADAVAARTRRGAEVEVARSAGVDGVAEYREGVDAEAGVLDLVSGADVDGAETLPLGVESNQIEKVRF